MLVRNVLQHTKCLVEHCTENERDELQKLINASQKKEDALLRFRTAILVELDIEVYKGEETKGGQMGHFVKWDKWNKIQIVIQNNFS